MVTIKDIAEKIGVSISTVSKGLNNAHDISDDMRQKVLDTAIEMGYSPRKSKSNPNKKICIFIENMDYENIDQFGYEIIVGFKLPATRRNWQVDVVSSNLHVQTIEKYDSYMLKNGYSGAFLLGFELHDDWIKQLSSTTVPTVLLDNFIEKNHNVGYVGTDSYEGVELAIDYLANLGHKRIAFLNGAKNSMVSNQRSEAFITSIKKHGLTFDKNLIRFGYYVPDCAKDHMPYFLDKGVTAVLCASDIMAGGVIYEIKKAGFRIPEDISVIGYDDLPIASNLNPSLTTIRQDRIELGKSAFILLDGLMQGISTSKLLLRPKFIVRKSTGEAPK